MKIKKQATSNNITSKSYSYAMGKCSLNFSLRNDIKEDMKDFLELLKLAQEDVEKEIKKL